MIFNVIKSLIQLIFGKCIFKYCCHKYCVDLKKDVLFIYPRESKMLEYLCLKYMAMASGNRDIVIVSSSESVIKKCRKFAYNVRTCFRLNEFCINSIICYITFKSLDNIFICSLNRPPGRFGDNIIGKNGITLEDVVFYGILKLNDYDRQMKITPNITKIMAEDFLKTDV